MCKKTLNEIFPKEAFKYFSGYTNNCCNLPMIYACIPEVKNQALIVIGRNFYQSYSLSEQEEAFKAYKILLKKNGYCLPKNSHNQSLNWIKRILHLFTS